MSVMQAMEPRSYKNNEKIFNDLEEIDEIIFIL